MQLAICEAANYNCSTSIQMQWWFLSIMLIISLIKHNYTLVRNAIKYTR